MAADCFFGWCYNCVRYFGFRPGRADVSFGSAGVTFGVFGVFSVIAIFGCVEAS